jgi:hypothetical protein
MGLMKLAVASLEMEDALSGGSTLMVGSPASALGTGKRLTK